VLPNWGILYSDEEVAAVEEALFDEAETAVFWAGLKRDVTSRRKTFQHARASRFERELEARFGIFKGMARKPWAAKLLDWWSEVRWMGKPLLPIHASVIILFMAYRGRLPPAQLALLCCLLFTVHPLLVVVGFLGFKRLLFGKGQSKYRPKRGGRGAALRKLDHNEAARPYPLMFEDNEQRNGHGRRRQRQVVRSQGDDLVIPETEDSLETEDVDVAFHGGALLARLYAAALTARAGKRVAVTLEEHDSKQIELRPKNAPCTFPLRVHLGQFPSCYAALVDAATPWHHPLTFEPVGAFDTGYVYAMRVFDQGARVVVLPAGIDQWLNTACEATSISKSALLHVLHQARMVANDVLPHVLEPVLDDNLDAMYSDNLEGIAGANKKSFLRRWRRLLSYRVVLPFRKLRSIIEKAIMLVCHREKRSTTNLFQIAASYSVVDALQKLVVATSKTNMQKRRHNTDIMSEDHSENMIKAALQKLAALNPLPARNFAEWCWGLSHSLAGFHRPRRAKDLYAALVETVRDHGGCFVAVPSSKAAASLEFAPYTPPRRTLIAFRGDEATLDVPFDFPVITKDVSITFSQVDSTEDSNELLVACVCEHQQRLSVEAVLAKIAGLFPNTKGNDVFAAPSAEGDEAGRPGSALACMSSSEATGKPIQCDIIPGPAGAIVAGWLAAHKALGYTSFDILFANRNIVLDFACVPR